MWSSLLPWNIPSSSFSSLIHSMFSSTTDLIFASCENLFVFVLSLFSNFMICNSALLFSGFSQSLSMFSATLYHFVHWMLSLHYRHWYFDLCPFIMGGSSLSFFHFLNMHSYTELICSHTQILQNVQATILLELCMRNNAKAIFFSIH